MLRRTVCWLAVFGAVALLPAPGEAAKKRLRQADIRTLTLSADENTRSNIGRPMPQLSCVGGCQGDLRMLQCENKGMDDTGEISWRCLGPVPKGCKFAAIKVSCEHYDRSQDTDDDDFIVPGSCAVEYSLECKRMGEAQAETAALRDKVQARREEQHQMMLSEVQRIQTQEVRDQCELTVAGALHEIGDQVEVKQEGFGGEVWWMFGEVEGIACDGTYTLATETGSPSGIRENDLRPHVTVTPVYYDYDPAESRGMGRRDGGTWAPPPPPPVAPASPTEMATVVLAIVVICVIAWAFGIDLSSTSPPSAAQSPAKPKVNQQATEDLAEQKRQAIMQLKTAKAQTRVAMVKAKQDAAEMARLNEYKTKIEQAERDINGDETQLGQARQSLDHVLDQYEAAGYAKTQNR